MAKTRVLAYIWIVKWSNAHTNPPAGMERELLRVRVPAGPGVSTRDTPKEVLDLCKKLGWGSGYALWVGDEEPPVKHLPKERLAEIRMRRLRRRAAARSPLFQEEFVETEMAKKPAYFEGEAWPPRETARV